MKSIILSLFLTIIAAAAAENRPPVSTNKWAGQYLGVLLSSHRASPERVEVVVFIWEDNSASAVVYAFNGDVIEVGNGTHVNGRVSILFPIAGYVLKGRAANHRMTGTVIEVVRDSGENYTFSAFRRWKLAYDPLYDIE